MGKWATTLYGFVDIDSIWDSTRSLNDLPGAPGIARPQSAPRPAGSPGRTRVSSSAPGTRGSVFA